MSFDPPIHLWEYYNSTPLSEKQQYCSCNTDFYNYSGVKKRKILFRNLACSGFWTRVDLLSPSYRIKENWCACVYVCDWKANENRQPIETSTCFANRIVVLSPISRKRCYMEKKREAKFAGRDKNGKKLWTILLSEFQQVTLLDILNNSLHYILCAVYMLIKHWSIFAIYSLTKRNLLFTLQTLFHNRSQTQIP